MEKTFIELNGDNYEIINTFSRGNTMYIALQLVGTTEDELSIELYRFREISDGIEILPIENELEFEKVAELFTALQEVE